MTVSYRISRRWEWYREQIRVDDVRLGAGSAPAVGTRQVGSSVFLYAPTLDFSNTVNQYIEFTWAAPVDMVTAQGAYLRFLWCPGSAWTAGNYSLKTTYLSKTVGASMGSGTALGDSALVTPASASALIETVMPTRIAIAPGDWLFVRFYRDTAVDTGNAVLQLLSISVAYGRWLDGRVPDVPLELSREY